MSDEHTVAQQRCRLIIPNWSTAASSELVNRIEALSEVSAFYGSLPETVGDVLIWTGWIVGGVATVLEPMLAYRRVLAEADDLLDAAPAHLRAALGDALGARAAAHAALQRIADREDRFLAAGLFPRRAQRRTPGELLFDGPSLYSRSMGYVSVQWGLPADEQRFAEESFDDYEAPVDARRVLHHQLLRLSETQLAVDFSCEALLHHGDDEMIARLPVADLYSHRAR